MNMKLTEVIDRLNNMARCHRQGINPMNSDGNAVALETASEMLNNAARSALLPTEAAPAEVPSTLDDFITRVIRLTDDVDTARRIAFVPPRFWPARPAQATCTRKHNCFASPEPCNGYQRIGDDNTAAELQQL